MIAPFCRQAPSFFQPKRDVSHRAWLLPSVDCEGVVVRIYSMYVSCVPASEVGKQEVNGHRVKGICQG